VTSVSVILKAADGTVLEQGAAVPADAGWRYDALTDIPAGAPITLEVMATDRPENKTVRQEVIP
jgi:hypothetical protein